MAGFPNRPSRTAYGPTREDERPVQNPKRELSAEDMNINFWQIAGMGLTAPRAVIGVDSLGTPVNPNFYQGLAWDPRQQLPDIVVTRNGTGDYTAVFQATYADEQDVQISTALLAGKASPQGTANLNGIVELPDAQTANIFIFDADAGTPIDSDFLLELW